MAHDVFISHSSKDKTVADAVCARLEARGIRCWVAPRDIRPGADWSESIIDAIGGSRVMVLVFSNHANASPQIKREIERAVNKGVILVPFRIENVLPAKSLEYFLSTPHWLDAYSPPLEKHMDYLADTVRHILDSGTEPVPRPAPIPPVSMPRPWWLRRESIAGIAMATALTGYWLFKPEHYDQGSFEGGWKLVSLEMESIGGSIPNAYAFGGLLKAAVDAGSVTGAFTVEESGRASMEISVRDAGKVSVTDPTGSSNHADGTLKLVSEHGGASEEQEFRLDSGESWDSASRQTYGIKSEDRMLSFIRSGANLVRVDRKNGGGGELDPRVLGVWREFLNPVGGAWTPTLEISGDGRYQLTLVRASKGTLSIEGAKWKFEATSQWHEGSFAFDGDDQVKLFDRSETTTWERD